MAMEPPLPTEKYLEKSEKIQEKKSAAIGGQGIRGQGRFEMEDFRRGWG